MTKRDERQRELPLERRPRLQVIRGLGQKQQEPLCDRDAVARVLVEAGADLLLRRISAERAEEIEGRVAEILELFDLVEKNQLAMPVLQRKLEELEGLMRDTRELRAARRR
jgi:hypothetical protein